jgi:uncharacterized protein (TIGR01244 family)
MKAAKLDEHTLVAGQIQPSDIAAAKNAGVSTIVNNRPDGEEPGQPTAETIGAAAREAGLRYIHIPIAGGFSPDQVEAMAGALESAEGKTLAFCKSGTRSTYLWALARARAGANPEDLVGQAAVVGYDLTPLLPLMTSLRS